MLDFTDLRSACLPEAVFLFFLMPAAIVFRADVPLANADPPVVFCTPIRIDRVFFCRGVNAFRSPKTIFRFFLGILLHFFEVATDPGSVAAEEFLGSRFAGWVAGLIAFRHPHLPL